MACQLETKPEDQVEITDAAEGNKEQTVDELIEELYQSYKVAEDANRVCDYMQWQSELDWMTRLELVDWLVKVHDRYDLLPETLYLAIDVMDRYLLKKVVSAKDFPLVGMSSLLVACKYEEIEYITVSSMQKRCKNAFTKEEFCAMEMDILLQLEWNLRVATPYVFLVKLIKAAFPADKEMENMAFYLAEVALLVYHVVVSYSPSLIAAAAVYAASHNLDRTPRWTDTLMQYTGYSDEELKQCAKSLIKFQKSTTNDSRAAGYRLQRKFSCTDRGAVTLLPPPAKTLETFSIPS